MLLLMLMMIDASLAVVCINLSMISDSLSRVRMQNHRLLTHLHLTADSQRLTPGDAQKASTGTFSFATFAQSLLEIVPFCRSHINGTENRLESVGDPTLAAGEPSVLSLGL
eukprot:COSAG02_NODE_25112_length_668_cov_17.606327_1_plen_111_part_10